MGKQKNLSKKQHIDKQVDKFFESNPQIKEALRSFEISEEQYVKVMRSMEPQITTSNKLFIEA